MESGGLDCPYELIELIGEGGMGQVFRARHMGLNRIEALKILAPRLAKDEQFVARLRREARATTMLTHAHIVSVFGFGRLEDGRYYLAMEHLEGETLESVVDREGATPERFNLRMLYQLASAMEHAHQKSVVHRDIKPANLMVVDVAKGPNLKVLDFGLAKILNPSYVDSVSASVAGTLYGTPGYLAPERLRGVVTDPCIDVYSFACVAYTLMTGRAPFVGRPLDVLNAHQKETPRKPSDFNTVNLDLEAIVMRCLSKTPSERLADGGALRSAIAAIAGFSSDEARRRTTNVPMGDRSLSGTAKTLREGELPQHSTLVDLRDDLPLAHTQDLTRLLVETHYQRELFALAEGLVEAGCRDVNLILRISDIYDTRGVIKKIEDTLSDLLREGESVEQTFRQKQSLLRFALGELSFQVSGSVSDTERKAAEEKANQLTEELIRAEHIHMRAAMEVADQEIEFCAQHHGIDEKQRENYAALLQVVDSNIDNVPLTPELKALLEAFRAAKSSSQSSGSVPVL